jgi:kynurenine 3-monooxygenase
MTTSRDAIVVGAGLAGSLVALLLAERGFNVDVYERRADPRGPDAVDDGRSINLGMSKRALNALKRVGLLDEALRHSVPMRGRIIHQPDGTLRTQAYGTQRDETLHAVRRRDLNAMLVEAAERHPAVRFHFGTRLTDLAPTPSPVMARFETVGGQALEATAAVVIGADGAFSTVRRCLHRGIRAQYRQDFLEWGHKELTIAAAADGSPRLTLNALHIWPRPDAMIVAHPNQDNSLTATLFLAHEGPVSFASLHSPDAVHGFFAARFPDLLELAPDLLKDFTATPVGELVTIRTAPWHHGGVVLIGDAAHPVYPFYGQGMNAALEDCLLLDACLEQDQPKEAFARFQEVRKRHTDALADLSEQNFVEFRDGMRSPWRRANWRAELALNRVLGRRWMPLYSMVSHSDMPYADAVDRSRRQERVLTWSTLGLVGGVLAGRAALAAARRGLRP